MLNCKIFFIFLALFASVKTYAGKDFLSTLHFAPSSDFDRVDIERLERMRNFCDSGVITSWKERYSYLKSGAAHGVGLTTLNDENFYDLMEQRNFLSRKLYDDINSKEFEMALNECGLTEKQKNYLVLTLMYFDTAGTTLGGFYFSKFMMKSMKLFKSKSPKWYGRVSKSLLGVASVSLGSKIYQFLSDEFQSDEDKQKEVRLLQEQGAIVIQSVEDLEKIIPTINKDFRKNLAINVRFKLWMKCRNVNYKIENDLYQKNEIVERKEKLKQCISHIRTIENQYSLIPIENLF